MPVLDGVSQSSHSTGLVYQNSTTPNPPKDYTQSNLKTAVVSIFIGLVLDKQIYTNLHLCAKGYFIVFRCVVVV